MIALWRVIFKEDTDMPITFQVSLCTVLESEFGYFSYYSQTITAGNGKSVGFFVLIL